MVGKELTMKIIVGVEKRQFGSVTIDIPDEKMKCSSLAQKKRAQKAALDAIAKNKDTIHWYNYEGNIAVEFGFMEES